jgi:positive regulator of sigma E activity
MANVSASVVKTESGLAIEAARQSTCQHCDKQASCASQWHLTDANHTIPVGEQVREGDTVTLECSDQSLLLYFALLFLPALSLLLFANAVFPFLHESSSVLLQFTFQVMLPLSLGAGCSRYLLGVFEPKLKSATRFKIS